MHCWQLVQLKTSESNEVTKIYMACCVQYQIEELPDFLPEKQNSFSSSQDIPFHLWNPYTYFLKIMPICHSLVHFRDSDALHNNMQRGICI